MQHEDQNTEYKLRWDRSMYKDVIAFANSEGGVIWIGVTDDGTITGLDSVDDELNRITNGLRDAISPDVTMFVRHMIADGDVIRIEVSEGCAKPYYLADKGMTPRGVFVRQGASAAPASHDQIRRMIKESDGDVFCTMRSGLQKLTLEKTKSVFRDAGLDFGPDKYLRLGIIQESTGLFTNTALLLSEQCGHSVKVAVFEDSHNTVFRDAREFTGPILTQLEEAFAYIGTWNRTHASINGLHREERPDYPEEAIREGLINALVHRDYGLSGSIIVNINDNSIEFISLGGIVSGLTKEDLRAGISQPRNRDLADIFHRLHLIESYGTGIRRIYQAYADCSTQPRIEATHGTFRLILPNRNAATVSNDAQSVYSSPEILPDGYVDEEAVREILTWLQRDGFVTAAIIRDRLCCGKTRAYKLLNQMQERGQLVKGTSGRGRYTLPVSNSSV